MATIFIGGHGRCNEGIACPLPAGVEVKWFGDLGKPVSKRVSGAILRGTYTTMTGLSSQAYPPCEHYSCESIALESEARAAHFLLGPWNRDTYLVQAKPASSVPLSYLVAFALTQFGGGPIDIRWAVCRSSVVYSHLYGHDLDGTGRLVDKPREFLGARPGTRAASHHWRCGGALRAALGRSPAELRRCGGQSGESRVRQGRDLLRRVHPGLTRSAALWMGML